MTRSLGTLLVAAVLAAAFPAPPDAEGQVVAAPVARGWIGISFEVTTTSADGRVTSENRVTEVMPGSPAERAGIRAGDVLIAVNGFDWNTDYARAIQSLRPGDPVRLVLDRDGARRELRLTAGSRPAEADPLPTVTLSLPGDSLAERLFFAMDSLRVRLSGGEGVYRLRVSGSQPGAADTLLASLRGMEGIRRRSPVADSAARVEGTTVWVLGARGGEGTAPVAAGARAEPTTLRPLSPYVLGQNRAAGAEVVELRPELATYFQVDGGVLVVDVPPRTPAHDAGIQPGDVVTHVDGAAVHDIGSLRRGLVAGADPITLTVVRKGSVIRVRLPR